MPQCPICETLLKQNFGMVTCEECQAVLMIDISGQIQVGSEMADEDITSSGLTSVQDEIDEAGGDDIAGQDWGGFDELGTSSTDANHFGEDNDDTSSIAEELELSNATPDELSAFGEQTQSREYQDDNSEIVEPLEEVADWSEVEGGEADDNALLDSDVSAPVTSQIESEIDDGESFSIPETPDNEAVDITGFANSEVSSLEGGEFLYDIKVSRLDSREHKDNLKYVLMDRKLKIDGAAYIKAIRDGEVTIVDLNPIKAKRVVEQLQFMDVDISWKQKRIVMQSDSSEEGTDDVDL